jgi:hypothetical protein
MLKSRHVSVEKIVTFMALHCIILLLHFIVLAKGGSKLETTTAQLARKSSVCSETPAEVPTNYLLETCLLKNRNKRMY